MFGKKRISELLVVFILLVSFIVTIGVSSPALASQEGNGSKEVLDKVMKSAVVLYNNSPFAYINYDKVQVDEDNPNVKPFIEGQNVFVPIRFVTEAFNAEVGWNEIESKATIKLGAITISMSPGSKTVDVSGSIYEMDAPSKVVNSRMFIPLNDIADILGKDVYFHDRGLVSITEMGGNFNPKTDMLAINHAINLFVMQPVAASLTNDTMAVSVGDPAIISPDEEFPKVLIEPYFDGMVSGEILFENEKVVSIIPEQELRAHEAVTIPINSAEKASGLYTVKLAFNFPDQGEFYDNLYFSVIDTDKISQGTSLIVSEDETGKLNYVPDFRGNQILDFSNAGYMSGGVKIPDVPVMIVLEPVEGDNTAHIQTAIDTLSKMPVHINGFRGAILLKSGTYEIAGNLRISSDGIVLRGEGSGENGSILYATGKDQRSIIVVSGTSGALVELESARKITDIYVPVGAKTFNVEHVDGLNVGDTIAIRRYGNEEWIHEIEMDRIVPRPADPGNTQQWGPLTVDIERIITNIEGNMITVDASMPNAVESRWGGGEVLKCSETGRAQRVGIENLRFSSEFDPSVIDLEKGVEYYADENKANCAVTFDNASNGWVREVEMLHLDTGILVAENAKYITIQDCRYTEPVCTIAGSRRYPYSIKGQLNLVLRCYADQARHAFAIGPRIPGPNAFVYCESERNYASSEPHHRWSMAGLYDNVKGSIQIQDRQWMGTGHGWSGANYVAWNTEGFLVLQRPPTAQNWSIGHVGEKGPGAHVDIKPLQDGYWESHGEHVKPESLYMSQLKARLGEEAVANIQRHTIEISDSIANIPKLDSITIDGEPINGFAPDKYEYTVALPIGAKQIPVIDAASSVHNVSVEQSTSTTGVARIKVVDANNNEEGIFYTVTFFVLTDKPVIASGDDGNIPENTIDNDPSTRWSAAGEQWIQYYLGGVKKVNGLSIATFRGHERKAIFDIQTTVDGVNWTTVYTGGASGTSDQIEIYKCEPIDAAYVRIVGYGNSDNHWNSFTEVIIHTGDDYPQEQVEEPEETITLVEGAQLLTEDFEDGTADGWEAVSGEWQVIDENGNKVYNTVAGTNRSVVGESTWDNYTVEAKMMVSEWSNPNTQRVGFYGRYQDNDNNYQIVYEAGQFRVRRQTDGKFSNLVNKEFTLEEGKWYTLKAELAGTSIKLYVDGVEMLEVEDNDGYSAGQVGLIVRNGTAVFDDIVVTELIPEGTPTLAEGAELLTEDFEDGTADGWEAVSGEWQVIDENGNKVYNTVAGTNRSVVGESTWDNYTVEAKMMVSEWSNPSTQRVGFYGRYQDNDNNYQIVYEAGQFRVRRQTDGKFSNLVNKEFTLETGKWYTLKAELAGTSIKLYVDGVEMLAVEDDVYSAGKAGLIVRNGTAVFDDIVITELVFK